MQTGAFDMEKRTGIWKRYHENGTLYDEGEYNGEKKVGEWWTFDGDGNLVKTKTYKDRKGLNCFIFSLEFTIGRLSANILMKGVLLPDNKIHRKQHCITSTCSSTGTRQENKMSRLRLYILDLVSGIMSGVLGGLAAGLIFGLALTIFSYLGSGTLPESLFEIVFPELYVSLIVGLIGGLLLGTIVGLTLPLTRPHLARISPILGGITAMIPSLLLLNSRWPIYISGVTIFFALIAGMLGGNVAFKFYTKIYR